jgi:hypothetical protein
LAKQAQISTTIGKAMTNLTNPEFKSKPSNQKPTAAQVPGRKQKAQKLSTDKEAAKEKTALDKATQQAFQKQRQARYNQALKWLCQTYPACFNLQDPKPLKVGIVKDILKAMTQKPESDQPSHVSIRHAMAYYVQGRLYHQAILNSSHRCDLTGQQTEEITAQDRDHAQAQIEAKDLLKQQWQEKKEKKSKPYKTNSEETPSKPSWDQPTDAQTESSS